ncbi:MAG: polyprenyl diphosphate synthase, partial [Hyphomicrobiaceae bacterium]
MAQTLSNLETSPSPARFPRHIAIIMDGNGRWARARKLPRAVGHRYGVDAVRRTVKAAIELSIPYLTLYSFSTENWSRPAAEVSDLLQLMRRYLQRDLGELHASGVRIKVIGQRDGVDRELRRLVDDAVALTANNRVLTLIIAFNYGGRDEIVEAARRIARDAVAGTISPEDVTAETIATALETSGIPDPDLLIRT